MNVIECIDLCKIYERQSIANKKTITLAIIDKKNEAIKTVALDKINLSIEEGEFVVIMGPSGSGKSTLLNTISTIDTPTSGKALINGTNVSKLLEYEICEFRYNYLGFIFQNFNVLHNLTIEENISLPLSLASEKTPEEIHTSVSNLAQKIGIDSLLDKFPSECSGGQIQRVAVARALINNPKLILADEPTGNLDSENSHEILNILKNLNETENKTVVMVTHDNMIASYGTRVVFLRDGKIEKILSRGNKTQSEFFYDIVDVTSKASRMLFK